MHRRSLARLSAERASGHRLRLSRAWAVSAATRPSLQSAQAVARSVCAQTGRAVSLVGCAVRLSRAFESRRPFDRPARLGAGHAEVRRDRRSVRLVARQAPECAVGRDHHLRNACARRVDAARRFAPARTRHVRRAGVAGVHRAFADARRDRGRIAAGPRVSQRPLSGGARLAQLLGLQQRRVLRTRAVVSEHAPARRNAHRRAPVARSRHRSDFSTWSTTTPAKATRWARPSRGAASTTPATIA